MIDIKETIKKIEESAQNNVEDVRFIKSIEVGQIIRQGDIYIHAVEETHTKGLSCDNQLAEGDNKGSRHIAMSPATTYDGIEAPSWCDIEFLGPVVVSPDRFLITHPEHADISLPAGTYQITHQMDARTLKRVKD